MQVARDAFIGLMEKTLRSTFRRKFMTRRRERQIDADIRRRARARKRCERIGHVFSSWWFHPYYKNRAVFRCEHCGDTTQWRHA